VSCDCASDLPILTAIIRNHPHSNFFARDVAETPPDGLPMLLTGRGAKFPTQMQMAPGVEEAAVESSFIDLFVCRLVPLFH